MSKLLRQLTELQNTLTVLGEKYQTVNTELTQLKTRPLVDVAKLDEVNHQLELVVEHNVLLEERINEQQQQFLELEQRFTSLRDAYHIKELELSRTNQQIEFLNSKYRKAEENLLDLIQKLKNIDNEVE